MTIAKLYSLQDIPGKGQGLIATGRILKGTRIISEPSILPVPRSLTTSKKKVAADLAKKVAALNRDKRDAFFSLQNAFKDEATPELGIIRTNALPLGSAALTGGIFLESSRINHACMQNAQNTWNDDLQKLTIHAIRDIEEGEEITILYLPTRGNRAFRQRVLQQSFRFHCSCQLCSLIPPQLDASDGALDKLQSLDEAIGNPFRLSLSPLLALHDVHEIVRLCNEQNIADASIPRAYYDAFQVAIYNGDRARAKIFAERAHAARIILEGEDSPEVKRLKALAANPSKHSAYKPSSSWATSTSDIPSNMSEVDFEAWLWKSPRVRTKVSSKYADLRDESMFPSFESLPWENDLDLDYYNTHDGITYSPTKHWCLLAEIVDIEEFIRLRLLVRDKAGHEVIVAFYTDGRGTELRSQSPLKRGHTIAILYPQQHGFLDMTIGIRVEDSIMTRVFPMSLTDMFQLSDKVQQYTTTAAEESKCQACGKKLPSLKRCARCLVFGYCDKSCQTRGWKEKGHNKECKLLADLDMKTLLELPQDSFKEFATFAEEKKSNVFDFSQVLDSMSPFLS
ncbi:SET domain-containing protein [Paramyrothecium foliicola]|nr:SET domain-containing protein [Paramyrothecium foliicola]